MKNILTLFFSLSRQHNLLPVRCYFYFIDYFDYPSASGKILELTQGFENRTKRK